MDLTELFNYVSSIKKQEAYTCEEYNPQDTSGDFTHPITRLL